MHKKGKETDGGEGEREAGRGTVEIRLQFHAGPLLPSPSPISCLGLFSSPSFFRSSTCGEFMAIFSREKGGRKRGGSIQQEGDTDDDERQEEGEEEMAVARFFFSRGRGGRRESVPSFFFRETFPPAAA